VFSVVYSVLLRPLPFPGANRFVEIVPSTLLHRIGIFGARAPRTLRAE
jgi:hypothetical protein